MRGRVWLSMVCVLVLGLVAACAEEESTDYDLGAGFGEGSSPSTGTTEEEASVGAEEEDSTTPTTTETQALGGVVRGLVLDTIGERIFNAQVQLSGPDYDTTINTNVAGSFEFGEVPFGDYSLKITHEDFASIHRGLTHSESSADFPFEFITKRALTTTLSTDQGGEVVFDDAKVTFPAGGYISDVTGAALEGELEVHITYFDANDPADIAAAPPLYRLLDDASGSSLISFGMVDVELFVGGEAADLGPGQTATLDLPLDGHLETLANRDSVAAWWYDTAAGTWVREGEGEIVNVDGSLRWQAAVSHFTTWNADDPSDADCSQVGACGTNVGVCSQGNWKCVQSGNSVTVYDGQGGQSAICEGNVNGTAETCNRLDDDCDGSTDETFPGKGDVCYDGADETRGVGACQDGGLACSGGNVTCAGQILPKAEACDGIDGDCDGKDDRDDEDACDIGYACFQGTEGWSCQPF